MRSEDRQFDYDRAYMKMAQAMGSLSWAQRKKVGAIIVSEEDQVISQGYNGTPSGWDNCCEKHDPITQRLITVQECLHAESNAIAKCARSNNSTINSTIYVTLSPCIECAKLIIQCGIKRVVFEDVYRDLSGVRFLTQCGVQVEQINMGEDTDKWRFIKDVNQMKESVY